VHGNETSGTTAIRREIDEIHAGALFLTAGRVTFVPITNPLAYENRRRQGDRNLNRRLAPTDTPREFEDHIANWLCPLLAQHEVLLDLHSFHTGGEPFVMVGPENNPGPLEAFSHAALEEALAVRLGVRRIVDGWLDTYAIGVRRRLAQIHERAPGATDAASAQRIDLDPDYGVGTTEYMRRVGGWAFTLECGQHDDPRSPEVAYRAILNTLAHLKMIDAPAPAPVARPQALRLFDVFDKESAGDRFARDWASFDAVAAGELIGTREDGRELRAPSDVHIVFPNPAGAVGQEWFYLARPTRRFDAAPG